MLIQAKPLLQFLTSYRWPLFILWVFVFRLPHILGADLRLDGDGAHHWLVMDRIYKGEAFVLHPHGMDHIGLIEFLFATPFVAIFGHTQLPYQLGLALIFLLTTWPLFLFARRGYGEGAASWVLLLMALPHPFIQFISLRPYGGHLLCNALGLLVLYLWWRRVSNPGGTRSIANLSGARDLLYWLGVGALGGIALYTNRLYAIPLAAHLGVWILHALTRKNARQFVALLLFACGFAIGGLPQWLGGSFEPFAPNYPNAGFNPGLENLESNAAVFASTLLPNLLDVVYFDGFGEAGFVPPGDVKKIVPVWQWLIVLLAIAPLVRLVPRGIAYLRGDGELSIGVLATAIIAVNTLAILLTKLPIWGFSARYFIASILILIPVYAAFAAGLYDAPALTKDASGRFPFSNAFAFLNRVPLLGRVVALVSRRAARIYAVGHLVIFIAAYAYGYRPGASIYSKPATAGAAEVTAYLKANGHERCLANYWIAYNIIYSSERTLLASPTTQYPGLGPVRDPQIEREILEDPAGVRCVIDHRFTIADPRNAMPGKIWTPVKDGPLRMRISERRTIADWVVLIGDPVPGR